MKLIYSYLTSTDAFIDLILQVSHIGQVLPLAKFIGVEGRIYASVNQANIGSCNGLSSVKRQAIIWTPAGSFLNAPLGKKINDISIKIPSTTFIQQ